MRASKCEYRRRKLAMHHYAAWEIHSAHPCASPFGQRHQPQIRRTSAVVGGHVHRDGGFCTAALFLYSSQSPSDKLDAEKTAYLERCGHFVMRGRPSQVKALIKDFISV